MRRHRFSIFSGMTRSVHICLQTLVGLCVFVLILTPDVANSSDHRAIYRGGRNPWAVLTPPRPRDCVQSRSSRCNLSVADPLAPFLVLHGFRLRGGSDDDDSPLIDEDGSEMEVDSEIGDLRQDIVPPGSTAAKVPLSEVSGTVKSAAPSVETKPPLAAGTSAGSVKADAKPSSFAPPRSVRPQPKRSGPPPRNRAIRPAVSRPLKGPIRFQLLDVDYTRPKFQNAGEKEEFVVHAFGTTEAGNSVHVGLRGFLPYFFVGVSEAFAEEARQAEFVALLNEKLRPRNRERDAVVKSALVWRKNILGYRRAASPFLQLFCTSPEAVRLAASMTRNWDPSTEVETKSGKPRLAWLAEEGKVRRLQTFESNVDPITRLSTDTSIVLSGWVQLAEGRYSEAGAGKVGCAWCDLDLTAEIADLEPVEGKEEVAPFLVGSFDIECVPEGGRGFPDPKKPLDRCVQIGTVVYRFGEAAPCLSVVMTLGTADVEAESGVEIREFADERALLMAWKDLVVHELDLDLLTGHNIFKFDLNYVAERAKLLRLHDFFFLGRLRGLATGVKSTESQSKAFGHNQFHYLPMTGRMQMDIYNLMTKNHKLSSYKLDSMAKLFLGDHKDDVSPKQIFEFQVRDAHHRGIVAKYCAKDCELVYRLVQRLDYLPQYLEMSKVTGVTMNDLNTRGQQIKVFTQIVREARLSGFVVPDQPRAAAAPGADDVQYQGAFVLKPQRGIYQEPIATLDFASLYPSIIRGDNLSYETLVTDDKELEEGVEVSTVMVEQGAVFDAEVRVRHGDSAVLGSRDDAQFTMLLARLRPGMKLVLGTHRKTDAIEGPAYEVQGVEGPLIRLREAVTSVQGEVVVKRLKLVTKHEYRYVQHVEGILPRICKNLLTARKKAKKEMAATSDPVRKGLLNGKQLALKVSCNSVYGFTGAGKGMLPCLPIASSVTAIGQQMIKTTKATVEAKYNATVIYGDTDSVMVNFHCGDSPEGLARALQMGSEAAKAVTSKFKPPNELEFEKVYMPYILYSKKRYAGQMYTRADRPDKIDIKGLQVVRRDNSQLARDVMKSLINSMVTPISDDELAAHPGLSKTEVTKDKVRAVVRDYIDALADNKFALDKFVISQSISKKGYDDRNAAGFKSASLGHVKLAERMERREPGTGPVTGDRVPFVVVKEAPHLANFSNRTIAGVSYAAKDWPPRHERCEDPAFVREHNLTVDLEYYLANQLKNPIVSLLEPLFDNTDELFAAGERRIKNRCSGNSVLTSFFNKAPKPKPPPPVPATNARGKGSPPAAHTPSIGASSPAAPPPPPAAATATASHSLPLEHFFRKRGPLPGGPAPKPPKHAAR